VPNVAKRDLPMMPWFPKDYLSATRLMSLAQRGAYCDLLFYQWELGPLPDDVEKLARLIGASLEEFTPIWKEIENKFAQRDGKRINETLESHREEATRLANARSKGAKITNAKRALSGDAQLSLGDELGIAHPSPSPSPQKEKIKRGATKLMPKDYHPSAELVEEMRKECTLVNLEREFKRMGDWEFRTPRSDWDAVYRGWMRRAQDNALERGETPQAPAAEGDDPWQRGPSRGVHY
jgi:uncharacterized protein YdaU (DUF1376 family)